MNTYSDRTQESKSQLRTNPEPQKQSSTESSIQFEDNRPEAVTQRKFQKIANNSPRAVQLSSLQELANNSQRAISTAQLQAIADNSSAQRQSIPKNKNNTGLPDNLKSSIENLSGYSLDDVNVHYDSDKPAQLNAYAYAQGTDIHMESGQEKHLAHEAWHVVQQKQGRVKPTLQMKGGALVNDDTELEIEADRMGGIALGIGSVQLKNNGRIELPSFRKLITSDNFTVSEKVSQLATIKGIDINTVMSDLIDEATEGLNFDSQSKGRLRGKVIKLKKEWKDTTEALTAIKEMASIYSAELDKVDAIKDRGDKTEAAAAEIINGKINRGKNGRDVEWRFITREMADNLKSKYEYATDQDLFENWRAVVAKEGKGKQKEESKEEQKDDYSSLNAILSTPPDAFSSTTIALAGGPAKFDPKTGQLFGDAVVRIKQLKKLAEMLKYQPLLVFSAAVSCDQCDYVASTYGISVEHLGEGDKQH